MNWFETDEGEFINLAHVWRVTLRPAKTAVDPATGNLRDYPATGEVYFSPTHYVTVSERDFRRMAFFNLASPRTWEAAAAAAGFPVTDMHPKPTWQTGVAVVQNERIVSG